MFMKICHITSHHKSTDTRIFHKQCTSLAKAGYDVYLLVQNGKTYESNGVKILNIETPVIPNATSKFILLRKAKSLIKIFQRNKIYKNKFFKAALEIDADIYQMHDTALLSCALKLKKKNKKVIFDSHENYVMQLPQYIVGMQNNKIYHRVLKKIIGIKYYLHETKICKRIDAVIFPCTMSGKNIFKNRAKQTIFINNTPLLNELYYEYELDSPKKDRSVCYVGGLSQARGITQLIKASYITNTNLILAGHFSNPNYSYELKFMEEYKCVDYRGTVDRKGITNILKESYIGACNVLNVGQYNRADNLATKVYEYMSMGLPVIITDCQYVRKVNEKYNCFILVEPDNIEQIANAIKYLLDNPEIAEQMGKNGRRAVLEEFNWEIEEKKLLSLYKSLGER